MMGKTIFTIAFVAALSVSSGCSDHSNVTAEGMGELLEKCPAGAQITLMLGFNDAYVTCSYTQEEEGE